MALRERERERERGITSTNTPTPQCVQIPENTHHVARTPCQPRHNQQWPHLLSGPISRDIAILSLRQPTSHDTFSGRLAAPQNGAIPPTWCLVSHRRTCAIPHFATFGAIIAICPPPKKNPQQNPKRYQNGWGYQNG